MSFQIKPDKKESENKCIRFPLPLIEKIEDAIIEKDVTFSGFVIQACEYALNELSNHKDSKVKNIRAKSSKRNNKH